ncbi:MAG TPA: HlyC/CorC family transporter [Steroidobacteraceae bacterium]|nr:HlyC/CorC family transporter [Steroidobacteraceae bacterium]
MNDFPVGLAAAGLAVSVVLSAFFASSETALMSVNRYRLRHLAQQGHAGARLAERLLARPDRLIGVMLLGNTLANVAAAAIVTLLTLKFAGEQWLALANGGLTLVLLLFCEVGPKTYGALNAERLALPASFVYRPLLWITYPLIWLIIGITNALFRLVGVSAARVATHSLSADELRTVVAEAGALIPLKHQQMLVSILDLEKISVDEIMVPRSEVGGINLNDDWDRIRAALREAQHTRVPVYEGDLDHIVGVLHMKRVARELARGSLDRASLERIARQREPYYVPEGTTLNQQLVAFQQNQRRHAYVVDEYGDVQGLVTIEDILEEIVGEFTTLPYGLRRDVRAEGDGSYVVSGSTTVRSLNRALGWTLPTAGPKTLNGLILEYLETIPQPGTALKLQGHAVEVLQIADNAIKTVRIWPAKDR